MHVEQRETIASIHPQNPPPAYPNLDTARIRTNAAIRHGFAGATAEEGAAQWLHNLGFPTPTTSPLEREMIPTLVFGGLSPLKYAHCLILELAQGTPRNCRDWLHELAEDLSYGERVPPESAIVAGFSASGLGKLGVGDRVLAGFPTAFQRGMAEPSRARALGDTGANAPITWAWGGPEKESDAIVLLYADDEGKLQTAVRKRTRQLCQYGQSFIHHIR